MTDRLVFEKGSSDNRQVGIARFEIMRGDVLRVTSEHTLIYIPETNAWFEDVIAYGQWWDLEADEALQLREAYNLDALMQDHLERGGEQRVTNDRYAAAK